MTMRHIRIEAKFYAGNFLEQQYCCSAAFGFESAVKEAVKYCQDCAKRNIRAMVYFGFYEYDPLSSYDLGEQLYEIAIGSTLVITHAHEFLKNRTIFQLELVAYDERDEFMQYVKLAKSLMPNESIYTTWIGYHTWSGSHTKKENEEW